MKRYNINNIDGIDIDTLQPTDNLIIKGNNQVVLSNLLETHRGKVKLIYIDPPYNTGNKKFVYNDSMKSEEWLSFMQSRLVLARQLLREDGCIFVQLDNKEVHYLKVLMDEVFGRDNFRSQIIWDTSIPYVAGNKWLSNNFIYSHSAILYYAKNKKEIFFNKQFIEVQQPSGDISKKPMKDVWVDIKNFAGFLGAKDIKLKFNSRKPEALIERIIECSTKPGDLVLDFFLGSGTTAAVAHKMNRQYIGVEQMDYIDTVATERLKKVIQGEQGGISKSQRWSGGGSFVRMDMI